MRQVKTKICGLTKPDDVEAVASAGAAYAGMVFFDKSPRNLSIEAARSLSENMPPRLIRVALVVDADDAFLDQLCNLVPLEMLQLQGRESVQRVSDIRRRYKKPVIKAIGVSTPKDLREIDSYSLVADQILVDAKPPPDADLPGGNGTPFDWTLLEGRHWTRPWMLAGGLNAANVADAITLTNAPQVDVSSAVETAPGKKDAMLIQQFVSAVNRVRHSHGGSSRLG